MNLRALRITVLYGVALAVSVVAHAAAGSAVFDTSKWTWQRPISAEATQAQFVRLPLPLDVLDLSLPSLADLRVVNAGGNLTPFVIRWGNEGGGARLEWKDAQLLNPVFQPEQYSQVTVDLGAAERRNRIKVATSGENYRRRVLIEGSTDGTKWDILLEDGWLFDVPLPNEHYKVDELTFPLSNFRYLRLTIFNMSDDPRRIDISAVQTAFWDTPPGPALLSVDVKAKQSSFDEKEHVSVYEFDLGYKYVPVVAVDVTISDNFYYRVYELSGRNFEKEQMRHQTETGWKEEAKEAPWQPVTRGVFYRMQRDDKVADSNSITGINAPFRYLRLRVFEQDNTPLTIQATTVRRREISLAFDYRPGETYTLIGGNPEATPPSFDLATTQRDLDSRNLAAAATGAPQPLQAKPAAEPWHARYSVLLWIALVLAVVIALGLIVRNLGKLRDA